MVWSFARSGRAILAGTTGGVARLGVDGQWNTLPGSREFGSISSLLPGQDGSLYAVVSREAVIRLSAEGTLAARTLPRQAGQPEVLARASDGSVWVAGSGIYRLEQRGREIFLAKDNPLTRRSASAADSDMASRWSGPAPFSSGSAKIAADPNGVLWGCAPGTLMLREAGTWRTIAAETPSLEPCLSLLPLNSGQAWVGYAASFLFALVRPGISSGSTLHEFRGGGDIGSATTYAIVQNTRGWLWRGSADGVYAADPAQAQAGAWLHLNDVDGLPELDVNHGSLFSDPDGSLWWGAGTSILHFSPPPDLIHPAAAPRVFASAFSLGSGPPKLAETVQQFPGGRKLTAHLGSLQFAERNALRIRYRVLPEQKEWRTAAAMDLDLGAPHWGTHTLEIQSRFRTGPWLPVWSRSLVVLHPWWFSWQSILGVAAFVSFGTAGAVTWRKKRRSRAQTDLPDLSAWRMAALTPELQLTGSILDRRFEVRDLVAQGGFATIFRGRDRKQNLRPCAIKIFRREVLDEQWHTHRFQQEVSALEQIRHSSVVSLYGHGTSPTGAPYLVMEFIEGGTLRDLLNEGPLPPARAARLLRQAAAALEQIHAHGIYHRDLKPENLMLRRGAAEGEELVLIDFSIAIVKAPDQTMHGLSRAAGTIYYMAPEQAVGFATPASDVHSLAKIVLEMITGQRLSTLLPHANIDLPDRARELIRGLPIRLSVESVELLALALEFDPARRPQAAMGFAQPIAGDLERASGE